MCVGLKHVPYDISAAHCWVTCDILRLLCKPTDNGTILSASCHNVCKRLTIFFCVPGFFRSCSLRGAYQKKNSNNDNNIRVLTKLQLMFVRGKVCAVCTFFLRRLFRHHNTKNGVTTGKCEFVCVHRRHEIRKVIIVFVTLCRCCWCDRDEHNKTLTSITK